MPLVKFWLQYYYSYTEKLYTSKSYLLAYYGYLKLFIIYHDGTCELIIMIIMQFWSKYFLHLKKKTQTSIKINYKIEEKSRDGSEINLSNEW